MDSTVSMQGQMYQVWPIMALMRASAERPTRLSRPTAMSSARQPSTRRRTGMTWLAGRAATQAQARASAAGRRG